MQNSASKNSYLDALALTEINFLAPFGKTIFVDGTNGSDNNLGLTWGDAYATIQAAVTASSAGDTIYVAAKTITAGATDPTSYAENIIIPAAKTSLSLIGVSRGRTQMGLPQIKMGGTVNSSLLTVRAGGCLIKNLGFNGNSTAGAPLNFGILLDDDGSTKAACGTTIEDCHFKNCAGSTVADATTGGAIVWSANGGAWQVRIKGNRFYKNTPDVCLLGTSVSVPQDVIIEDNIFSGAAADVDCNLWLKGGGSGMNGVIIRNNVFGQLPALSAGAVKRYIDATGCVGMLVGCTFGCQTSDAGGATLTFLAAGTAAKIPTTMHIANCWGQSITAKESGEVNIAANT
jgi:hypothetical protein